MIAGGCTSKSTSKLAQVRRESCTVRRGRQVTGGVRIQLLGVRGPCLGLPAIDLTSSLVRASPSTWSVPPHFTWTLALRLPRSNELCSASPTGCGSVFAGKSRKFTS